MHIEYMSIDIETFSDIDLKKSGVYKYTESENFEILLFGYSVNGGDVIVIDLASGETIPDEVIDAILDESVIKWAYNATFERICISAYLRDHYPNKYIAYNDTIYLCPDSWRCSLIWAGYYGLPLNLAGVGAVLKLDEQKMDAGKDLIRYFCTPCKATKVNGGRERNLPHHAPDKWELFKEYNKRDVEVEMSIQQRLHHYPVPDFIWDEYHLDQRINDRGIRIDLQLVNNAMAIDELSHEAALNALKGITNLENPNSVTQMRAWLKDNGIETPSLDKKAVSDLIGKVPPAIRSVLILYQQISKSSVKKYTAMINSVCKDNRCRGMFQFYGANRSGRWAGRLIQLQNLPQNHLPDLNEARELVRTNNFDALNTLYDSVPNVLSELIRTAFIPADNMKFIVADFSAIEARVLAFLADEKWRIKAFADGLDIYCASASKMFNVPVEKNGINGHLRQRGKVAELALGYNGSVGALKAMGAIDMGIPESELQPLVDAWRLSNPNIVQLWYDIEGNAKRAVMNKSSYTTHGITFECKNGMLFMHLPSGRKLCYVKPKLEMNQFGFDSITYEGLDSAKKWSRLETYGGRLVENACQAISRDILMYAMRSLSNYEICGHVHDEVIIQCPTDTSLNDICNTMGQTPPWIKGLLLRADGYECSFYKKD